MSPTGYSTITINGVTLSPFTTVRLNSSQIPIMKKARGRFQGDVNGRNNLGRTLPRLRQDQRAFTKCSRCRARRVLLGLRWLSLLLL